jgi:hypothetical protein
MIVARRLALESPGAQLLRAGAADEVVARRATPVVRSARASGVAGTLFTALVLLTVACGWLFRDSIPLTPALGVGNALGIGGGVTMLLLVLYPARKRLRFMRHWGSFGNWFRTHMILGILGPVMILFHCNFHFSLSTNSNVALVSMLVVALSGVVGRFIYTRISHGLYGARATFAELHAQLDVSAHTLGEQLPPASRASQRLATFVAYARAPHRILGGRFFRMAALPLLAMWVHHRVLCDLRVDLEAVAARDRWDARTRRAREAAARETISAYVAALVKEAQFNAYERLFSLWHALHIPLFFMLLLSGILHVLAVHKY